MELPGQTAALSGLESTSPGQGWFSAFQLQKNDQLSSEQGAAASKRSSEHGLRSALSCLRPVCSALFWQKEAEHA